MKRYAGDAQASELGRFDSTLRRMSNDERERYKAKGGEKLLEEIKAFEEEGRRMKEAAAKKLNTKKEEPIRFAGWADPRKSK